MYKLYCRIYQGAFRLASGFLPWSIPVLLEGEGAVDRLPALVKKEVAGAVLIVTDASVRSLGLLDSLLAGLAAEKTGFFIYDKTVPNPTVENVEEALLMYHSNGCRGIIAFGGGSPMDCAKGVAARIARPKKTIASMKGLFKVLKRTVPVFAVPTTSGTGSEATIAAVITDSATHDKFPVNDLSLIPRFAVLDPALTVGLPPRVTSTTGMDALTHAVEAYIGRSNTALTRDYERKAITLIFENIREAFSNGSNLEARTNMQKAAFYAGIAFTRAYIGYVHAIAHTLGGFYSIPHGLANAVILPHVLDYYGASAHKSLAELADLVHLSPLTDTEEQKAKAFIGAIRALNRKMDIPESIAGIREADIPVMIARALKEANPLYPVPKIFGAADFLVLYNSIKEKNK